MFKNLVVSIAIIVLIGLGGCSRPTSSVATPGSSAPQSSSSPVSVDGLRDEWVGKWIYESPKTPEGWKRTIITITKEREVSVQIVLFQPTQSDAEVLTKSKVTNVEGIALTLEMYSKLGGGEGGREAINASDKAPRQVKLERVGNGLRWTSVKSGESMLFEPVKK